MDWWISDTDQILVAIARLQSAVSALQRSVNSVLQKENQMAIDLTSMTAEVANNTSVTGSVVTLLNNLTAIIKAIPPSTDPVTQAALDELSTTLAANDTAAAAAVVQNTPSASAKAPR
jgi:hypothetical protein